MRVQKAASRVPSAPYNAKCHSNMSSSKGSAHVANALGSVSMCASESINSFISCEMRRTALFEEENFEVVSVVMSSSSSSSCSPRVSASRVFRVVVVCGSTKSKGSFPLPFSFEEIGKHFVSFCTRAGKIHDVFFSKRGRGRGRGETTSATAATIVSVFLSQKKTPRKKRRFRFRFFR